MPAPARSRASRSTRTTTRRTSSDARRSASPPASASRTWTDAGDAPAADLDERPRGDREHRARRAGRGPYDVIAQEVLVDDRVDRLRVAHRRHAADRETGHVAHERRVGLRRAEARLVHAVRAACDHEQGVVADAEDERLADLADLAPDRRGGLRRRARPLRELADLGVDARARERPDHPVDGAHTAAVGTRRAISWSVSG